MIYKLYRQRKVIGVKVQSQLNDGFDGAIVPMDNAGCANALADFILDKDKQNQFISNMKTTDYSNQNEVEKIYKLIGD